MNYPTTQERVDYYSKNEEYLESLIEKNIKLREELDAVVVKICREILSKDKP